MKENAEKIKANADCDGGVRDVKDRPNAEVDEIDHGFKAEPVDPVADRASEDKAERPPVHRRGPMGRCAMRTVRDHEKENKADRDHREKRGRVAAEKPEGNAGIPDKRQVQDLGNDRDRAFRRKIAKREEFGKLVNENYRPDKAVEEDY